jgi:aldehyde:ferredoxin oxidoreductase
MAYGYNGRILHIDLSKSEWYVEEPSETWYRTHLGGGSMALYYLLKHLKPGTDPLSDANILVFASNITSGLPISGFSRFTVAALSPLTGCYGDSEAGGFFGPELKLAGYDGIIVRGRAEKPVFLWIQNGAVEIRDASALWGLDNKETMNRIREDLGDTNVRIASIGPGGENLVRYANIVNELRHSNGRTGMGAVMGSKNLKAVAVRGKGHIDVADPDKVKEITRLMNENIRTDPGAIHFRTHGTAGVVQILNNVSNLPTRNFRESTFEGAGDISGEAMSQTILKGRESCYACAMRCKRVVACDEQYTVDPSYGGPEYETIGAFGSLCGNNNLPAIALAHELCNRYGLDSISTGSSIAFAMECFEEGVLTEKDLDGRTLHFGDRDSMLWLIEEIAHRRGIGNLLAEGVRRASEKLGHNTEKFANHVKGQESPMHDPRGRAGVGLGYVLSSIGADHNRALPDSRFQIAGLSFDLLKPLGILEPISVLSIGPEKVRAVGLLQRAWSLYDSLGVCIFVAAPLSSCLTFSKLNELVSAITGWETSLWDLLRAGERAIVMARMFNIREGIGPDEDRLFPRLFEPLSGGQYKGKTIDPAGFSEAVHLYYDMFGWDQKGRPTKGKLYDLGLEWLIE